MKLSVLVAAACLAALISCEREPAPMQAGRIVTITARCTGGPAAPKSSYGTSEVGIRDVNLYAYRGGRLEAEAYSSGNEVSVDLADGMDYRIYALANVGEVHPPVEESGLSSMTCILGDLSEGFPMVTPEARAVHASESMSRVALNLVRLVSRYDLHLERHFDKCSFEVTSVRLCQTAMDFTPFSSTSAASSVTAGDMASASDIEALNSGGTVSFYMLENCQGKLLPNNDDPWAKVPSNIPSKSGLCTYLQVDGVWTTSGASASLSYRMYLGEDNCTDFNIRRNTINDLSLILYDDGTLADSWKVEMSGVSDSRVLCFEDDEVTVYQGGGLSTTRIHVFPTDVSYTLRAEPSEASSAGLVFSEHDRMVSLSSNYVGPEEKTAHLYLTSWDGFIHDELEVIVTYAPGAFTDYTLIRAEYAESWGRFTFPTATASDPVSFSIAGKTCLVGDTASPFQSIYDPVTGSFFYFIPGSKDVWYRPTRASGTASSIVTLSRKGRTAEVTIREARAPDYMVGPVVLNENGEDYEFDVMLDDGTGDALDLSIFVYPEPLAQQLGMDEEERYENFFESYWNGMNLYWNGLSTDFWDAEPFGLRCDSSFSIDDASYGVLASLTLWGTQADGDKPLSGKLMMWNESFSGEDMVTGIPVTVNPAFPDQRYLGELVSYQIAPGSLRNRTLPVPFTEGGHLRPSGTLNWNVSSARFSPSDKPGPGLARSSSRSATCSMSGTSLHFSEPSLTVPPASGPLLLTGSVTNQHTGRTITGYYTLDLLLYVPIGVHADFDSGMLHYSFVPFCEYSKGEFADMWNDSFPMSIPVQSAKQTTMMRDYQLSYVHVPESPEDNQLHFHVGATYTPGPTEYACSYIYYNNLTPLFTDWHFFLGTVVSTATDYSRGNYGGDGSSGYYRLVRQMDINNMPAVPEHHGLDNIYVEAVY